MKTIFKTLLAIGGTISVSLAQQDKPANPTGFIRVVNGVAQGPGNISVMIDGEDMRPQGYKLGDATGGMGLRAGTHKVVIKKEGLEDGSTSVVLEKDQTVTLIPFSEKVPASDKRPAYFRIQILRLRQHDVESGRLATFVSVSANPEIKVDLQDEGGKSASAYVKRLAIAEMPLNYTQGYAPAKVNGVAISPIPIGGAGNYVVVLYDTPEGKVGSVYFRDFKFVSAE
ncbi:MAG: hypothetical protein ORN51_14265 [Akkermansiaceae bacterium]|nr:hypothetical protein [Akkermansiaceae bacterium]